MFDITNYNYTILNGRTISFSNDSTKIKVCPKYLLFDETKINMHDYLSVQFYNIESPYQINYVTEKSNIITISEEKFNISNVFLLPMIDMTKEQLLYSKNFCNSFFNDYYFYLKYRFGKNVEYLKFEESIKTHKLFYKFIDFNDKFVLIHMHTTERQKDIINTFKTGRYSQFPDNYKKQILRFNNTTLKSSLGQILYKSKIKQIELENKLGEKLPPNAELFDSPNLNQEMIYAEYKF